MLRGRRAVLARLEVDLVAVLDFISTPFIQFI